MIIATLREAGNETRVAITPSSAKHFIKSGFEVAIEKNAGLAAGFSDQEYEQVGVQVHDKKISFQKPTFFYVLMNQSPKG